MSQQAIDNRFPKGALVGAAGLVLLSLVAASLGRLAGVGTVSLPDVPAVESRDLRFEDQPDGGIAVYDAELGRLVYDVEPGTNGFIRGVLRGLARGRKLDGLTVEPPFRMTHWADGRLSIEDPLTRRWIDLGAFGPTNADSFARIFAAQGEAP